MLKVNDFSKKYRNNQKYSARHISFSVSTGEVVGLIGSNGAGKSTIIKSIIGVLPFNEGTITVGGYDIVKQSEQAKRLIGYVPDDHSVYEKLTGREYINYIGSRQKNKNVILRKISPSVLIFNTLLICKSPAIRTA